MRLIELIVLISIIGVFSSFVFVLFGQVRAISVDTHNKATLLEIRTQAVLFVDSHNGSTVGLCGNSGQALGALLQSIRKNNRLSADIGTVSVASSSGNRIAVCHEGGFGTENQWAVSLPMYYKKNTYLCVDSIRLEIIETQKALASYAFTCT